MDFTPDASLNNPIPQNIDAEATVLGMLLFNGEIIDDLTLPEEAYFLPAHQKIYKAAKAISAKNEKVDLMTITTWLNDNNLLSPAINSKLYDLIGTTVGSNPEMALKYEKLIKDKFIRRNLIKKAREIMEMAFDQSVDLEEILKEADKKIQDATLMENRSYDIQESSFSLMEQMEKELSGEIPKVKTGFYDLDNRIDGLKGGELIILAGRPSMGKSAVIVNFLHNMAIKKVPTLLFSLEMTKEEISQRVLSMRLKISSQELKNPQLFSKMMEELSALHELPFFINDNTFSLSTIKAQAMAKVRELRRNNQKLGCIAIDHLNIIRGDVKKNDTENVTFITRELKIFAKELGVPIILLSQLNRGVESRTDKRPMLSDLRQSGSAEQDADMVLLLYRQDYYTKEDNELSKLEVNIAKYRNGPTGLVNLLFRKKTTEILNYQQN